MSEKGNGVVGVNESPISALVAEIKIRLLTAASPAVGQHQIKYLVMRVYGIYLTISSILSVVHNHLNEQSSSSANPGIHLHYKPL